MSGFSPKPTEFQQETEKRTTWKEKSLQETGTSAEENPDDAEVPSSGINSTESQVKEARRGPLAREPSLALSMIYKHQGAAQKPLRFSLIAAPSEPSNTEEWVRLAERSLEQDNIKQAISCYTEALKYEPTNIRFLWEQSSLCEQMGDHEMAMEGCRRILSLPPASDGECFMQLAREKAKRCQEASDGTSAINTMEEAFCRHQAPWRMATSQPLTKLRRQDHC